METKGKLLGAALATAVGLALQGCAASVGTPANTYAGGDIMQSNPQVGNQILCYGVNACRGQSSCMMTTTSCRYVNQCAGKNSCKGQGGKYMTIAECQDAGGRVPLVPAPDEVWRQQQ